MLAVLAVFISECGSNHLTMYLPVTEVGHHQGCVRPPGGAVFAFLERHRSNAPFLQKKFSFSSSFVALISPSSSTTYNESRKTTVTERTLATRESISRAMTQKWQDPDYRRKMDLWSDRRRNDPTKSWSRRGVPKG